MRESNLVAGMAILLGLMVVIAALAILPSLTLEAFQMLTVMIDGGLS